MNGIEFKFVKMKDRPFPKGDKIKIAKIHGCHFEKGNLKNDLELDDKSAYILA